MLSFPQDGFGTPLYPSAHETPLVLAKSHPLFACVQLTTNAYSWNAYCLGGVEGNLQIFGMQPEKNATPDAHSKMEGFPE